MSVLKIADEIDDLLKEQEQLPWGTKQVYLDLAATMLRQQQAEIEAGKIMIKGYSKVIDEQQAEIEALKEKVEKSYDEGFKRGIQQEVLSRQLRGC